MQYPTIEHKMESPYINEIGEVFCERSNIYGRCALEVILDEWTWKLDHPEHTDDLDDCLPYYFYYGWYMDVPQFICLQHRSKGCKLQEDLIEAWFKVCPCNVNDEDIPF